MTEKQKKHLDDLINKQINPSLKSIIDYIEKTIEPQVWNAAREINDYGSGIAYKDMGGHKYPSLTDYNNRSEPLNEKG